MIGREPELRLVRTFLDGRRPGVHALLLYGEAGIGKTTVWEAAQAEAARRGFRVVSTRPTEAEARLPFAALNDLIGELADDSMPELPRPQRAALDVALMRADPDDEPIQPLALSLAVLGVLRTASEQRPLALAIDDAPWLDDSSVAVLRFALRRLESEPVVVIGAERVLPGGTPTSFLTELPDERLTRVAVRALDADELDRVLRDVLGLELPPTELGRLHRLSAGNPFFAVELGRALQTRSSRAIGEIQLPSSLAALLRTRLDALSVDARAVTVAAAALSQPTLGLLTEALGRERAIDGLRQAQGAGVVAADDDRIRFTHPLLAAEAYAGVNEADRRDLHARLATVVHEPEEHALHLALASAGPDASVAEALDSAATRAHARGAPDAAAELAEMAADLTPTGDDARYRRLSAAGRYRLMAGDVAEARELLERTLEGPEGPMGPARAALLHQLAIVRMLMDDFAASERLGQEALSHAGDETGLIIDIKLLLAGVSHITGRNWASGADHAFEAMRLAEELGDPRILAGTIGHYAIWRHVTGHGVEPDLAARAAKLEPWSGHLRTLDRPAFDFHRIDQVEGRLAASGEQMRALLERAEHDGDYSSLPFLLGAVGIYDFLAGSSTSAREHIDRARRLAKVTGQRTAEADAAFNLARLEARLGNAEAAWAAAREAFDHIAATSWTIGEWSMRQELALLELSRNDAAAALEVVEGAIDPSGPDESERWEWARPAAVDALVALGRPDDARGVLDAFGEYVKRVRWPTFVALAARSAARVLAAEGEVDAATARITEAEGLHRSFGDRWELSRTLLLAGEIHRRARRRAKARAALEEALDGFEFLGARLWAAQARQQLERIGAPRQTGEGLTPTQREVADLVAAGLTNRQVADRLFMSAHTVEAHLTAIYRALDIRSRVELESALARLHDGPRDSASEPRDSAPPRPPEN